MKCVLEVSAIDRQETEVLSPTLDVRTTRGHPLCLGESTCPVTDAHSVCILRVQHTQIIREWTEGGGSFLSPSASKPTTKGTIDDWDDDFV
jgi:hypothetical protein